MSGKVCQFLGAIGANMGGFALGTVIGWSSQLTAEMEEFGWNDTEISLVSSIITVGGVLSMGIVAILMDRIGRKLTMIVIIPPYIAGWIILALFKQYFYVAVICRLVVGMLASVYCIVSPVYCGEISQKEIRGTLGVFFQLLLVIGIFYAFVIGGFTNFRWLSILNCIPGGILALIMFFMPESPYFLLAKEKEESAKKSLKFFRRSEDAELDKEIQEMKKVISESKERKGTLKEMLVNKASRKGIITSFSLMIAQQLSGINIIMFYSSNIFKQTSTTLEEKYLTMIMGAVQIVATVPSAVLVDKAGRRVLLFISFVGMALCLAAVTVMAALEMKGAITAVSMAAVFLYVIFFSFGAGPLPWSMVGELFLPEYKGYAGSLCGLINWLCAFAVSMSFMTISNAFGLPATFAGYAILCVVSAVFVVLFVVETRGKTLDEIITELGNK